PPSSTPAPCEHLLHSLRGGGRRCRWTCRPTRSAEMHGSHNVELSHKFVEHDQETRRPKRWSERVIEIVEVAVLATVAIATAWSGYQAARWDGHQAFLYGQA